jgi:serine/threonine protein kinase
MQITGFVSFHSPAPTQTPTQSPRFPHLVIDANLCECLGQLQTLMELVKKRKTVSDTEARYFMWQLMEALMHLHKNLVIHRDLKLANIFLDENMCIKVGDFGLATKLIHKDERKK